MKIYYNRNLKELSRKLRNNQTSAEKALWHALKEKRLFGYDFHRQKPIWNFIYDFYSYKLKLMIEVDGITHNEPEVKENDKQKDDFIKSIGFNILRFTDDEVLSNMNGIVEKIMGFVRDYEKGDN